MENTILKEQLNLAHEREKHHLAELAIYRQHTLSDSTLNSGKNENKTPTEPDKSSKTHTESTNTPPHSAIEANQEINNQKTIQSEIIPQPPSVEPHQSKMNRSEATNNITIQKYEDPSKAQIQQGVRNLHNELAKKYTLWLESRD